MARDTLHEQAEAKADELGIKGELQRQWFIEGHIQGQRDALAECARRMRN